MEFQDSSSEAHPPKCFNELLDYNGLASHGALEPSDQPLRTQLADAKLKTPPNPTSTPPTRTQVPRDISSS